MSIYIARTIGGGADAVGTTFPTFRLGLTGPTFYNGSADPTVTPPTPMDDGFSDGDIYIRGTAGGSSIWVHDTAVWTQLASSSFADVSKVGTPVDNQIGVWTGDGTIEGDTALTFDGSILTLTASGLTMTSGDITITTGGILVSSGDIDMTLGNLTLTNGNLDVTGNIIVSGTVDGIDIATDVAANTLKVTNATHTGQVTGATALALDVTAVTAQPASGVIIGADTIIINDGGVLSEATMDQVATFANASSGDVSKVGTPVNNELGVWTGDGTIEGESGLTYDGTILTVGGAISIADALNLEILSTAAATLTLDATHFTVVGTLAGAQTFTLPDATAVAGRVYNIKKTGASGTLTVDTTSAQTIDGALTALLATQYDNITVQSDGANWLII